MENFISKIFAVLDGLESVSDQSTENTACEIQDSISSGNPLIKMFAVLDRRIGKRTLSKIESQMSLQPDWLK